MAFVVPRPRVSPGGSLLAAIGNTPLVRLAKIGAELSGIEIHAKAEFSNPGGSVKDRPALSMILEGERSGRLKPGRVILDATSGNTGIAYAMIGAVKGYQVKLCLPRNASPERVRILRAYGAEIVSTPAEEGSDGAIRRCREIYREDPDLYFYPDQYNNPANWKAHYETTAAEILRQSAGQLTHFLAALGTTGTFTGVTRRLREEGGIRCVSVQPASGFHGIEGTKHLPTSMVPGIYDPDLADENLWVETEAAHAMARRLARDEGLFVGISSGANVAAALALGRRLAAAGERAFLVTILCDGGGRYLSEEFWDDPD
jgi:cysteine synthase B